MNILTEISENLQKGKTPIVKEKVQQAIDEGIDAGVILTEGLLSGMSVIGEKFKNNEIYVPEVLVAARAMNAGTQILKPLLAQKGVAATGKVCIGTVQGDLHDIGKNLVKMMMEGKGLEVVDLGTDVSPEAFVNTAIEQDCQVICCSALLTTTMGVMEEVVELCKQKGIRIRIEDFAYESLKEAALFDLSNGGRGVGNQVEALLINPLSRWLFDNEVLQNADVLIEGFDVTAKPPCVRCRVLKEEDHA